jgi:dTDP-4-amino-4,6-dideoxygalactose transaminase
MLRLRNYGAAQKYIHVEEGTNSRLDTMQAAVLQHKLPYLPQWNRDRLNAAEQYNIELAPLASSGITPIQNHSGEGHIYHLYVIKVDDSCAVQRQQLQEELTAAGIQTGVHYPIPCHLQPAFTHLGYQVGDFPNAEILAKQILSLPMYPGLSHSQVKEVVAAIASSLSAEQHTFALHLKNL